MRVDVYANNNLKKMSFNSKICYSIFFYNFLIILFKSYKRLFCDIEEIERERERPR